MKVALLTTDNRGPHQEYEKDAPWFGMAPEALLSGFAALPELEVHVISCIRQPVKAPEKLADNIWFHSLHVPKLGWIRTGYQGCLRAVRRRLKRIQPDIVHGQGSEAEAAICAACSGFPNVITLLGNMREMARILKARPASFFWLAALIESISLRRTAGVLCNSRYTVEKVRPRTRQTWLVPNAIREPFFVQPLPAGRRDKCTILNVGTVCAYKRQNELLDVVQELRAEGLDFELQFFGLASPENPYVAKFLDRVRNCAWASYRGFRPLSEMIGHYDQASALVHVSEVETFGLVVAEALARNLKFFGFNVGGVPDVAAGVEGAELFADRDWPALKQALAKWIRSGFPRPVSAAGVMRERFQPVAIARQHLEIYRELLRGRAGAS